MSAEEAKPWCDLSPIELRIVRLGIAFVTKGDEVAGIIGVSNESVRKIRQRICKKVGVRYFRETLRKAFEDGIEPEMHKVK